MKGVKTELQRVHYFTRTSETKANRWHLMAGESTINKVTGLLITSVSFYVQIILLLQLLENYSGRRLIGKHLRFDFSHLHRLQLNNPFRSYVRRWPLNARRAFVRSFKLTVIQSDVVEADTSHTIPEDPCFQHESKSKAGPLCEPAGGLTGVEPALEGQAALLHVEGEVVDVERARRDHLDGFVVPHQSVVRHVDVRYVWRLPHVHAAGHRREAAR